MTVSYPLLYVRNILEDIVSSDDLSRLEECLAGKHLPALGGNDGPADILFRALSAPSFDRILAAKLSGLLGRLLSDHLDKIKQDSWYTNCGTQESDTQSRNLNRMILWQEEDLLYNSFLFASYLPADKTLFYVLIAFQSWAMEAKNPFGDWHITGRQLKHALVYQQVDPFVKELWLSIINSFRDKTSPLTLEEKADLMNAWRGLLWIPPSKTEGEIICFDRIEKGLLALYDVSDRIGEVSFLRRAIHMLRLTYPRSPRFWKKRIGKRLEFWPKLLQEVISDEWPMLRGYPFQENEPCKLLFGKLNATKLADQSEIRRIVKGVKDRTAKINESIGSPVSRFDDTAGYLRAA
jgi:hypothetical protein